MPTYDVAAVGNAIVDVLAPADDAFLAAEGLEKGSMGLIDDARARDLYARMGAGVEASGGSAANTVAGVASLGGRAAYVGKVGDDPLGAVFTREIRAGGVTFHPAVGAGELSGRCLVNVTPDGQRTMSTFLGAASTLTPADVDTAVIEDAAIVYLEGYLFDPEAARRAFEMAADAARVGGGRTALTLSDAFVVERHREELLRFLPRLDILLANEAEVMALWRTIDREEALARTAEAVPLAAVTLGAEGSAVLRREQRFAVAAGPVEAVVDTTGAGDQYAAGFLLGLARDLPVEVCAKLGHLAAAEVIAHYGPRPQTPLEPLARAAGLL